MSNEINFQTESSTAMSLENVKPLLEKIQSKPHWCIHLCPKEYKKRISDEQHAWDIINNSRVCFCSEYYPYIGQKESEQSFIASKIKNHNLGWEDYWFLFYSGQFLNLLVTPEIFYEEKLRKRESQGLNKQAPGFIEVTPLVERFGSIFLFVSKLCQAVQYENILEINIELKGIKDFVLTDKLHKLPNFLGLSPSNVDYVAQKETIQWNENIQTKDFSSGYALDVACKAACRFLGIFHYPASINKIKQYLQQIFIV